MSEIGELLYELVQIPGPSGYEGYVANKLEDELKDKVDHVSRDRCGNVVGVKKGTVDGKNIMVIAHMDEVSLIVENVDEFVWFQPIGLIDPRVLPGTPVTILKSDHRQINGVICAPAAHLTAEHPGALELWIDVGYQMDQVEPGDPVVFAANARWLGDDRRVLASKAIDDRVGCAVLLRVAGLLPSKTRNTITLVGSVQEEVGGFGARYAARTLAPDYVIVVDTGYAADATKDRRKPGRLGGGVIIRRFEMGELRALPSIMHVCDPAINDALSLSAHNQGIHVIYDINRFTFTDAGVIKFFSPEIPTSGVYPARRYNHSPVETIDIVDAENTAKVIAGAVDII